MSVVILAISYQRMRRPRLRALFLSVLTASIALLYFHGLGSSRIYLSVEEVLQALQAHAVASSGRDLTGRLLPLYPSEPWYPAGRDPIWIYAAAGLLEVAPFSEALIRIPSAAAGVLDVVLLFLVVRRIFRRDDVALAAAGLLALTPAHFFQSRIATSQIAPLPFLLAWLLFLFKYLETRRRWQLFTATAILGAGTYSYLSAVFLTPWCFLATLVVVGRHDRRALGPATAGFALALTPFVAWHAAYPERIGQLLGYYTANGYNTDLAPAGVPLARRVAVRMDTWWEALNPGTMFFSGDGNLRFSTRYAGHLLLPSAVFVMAGVVALGHKTLRDLWPLLIVGLLLAPLPAALATNAEIKRWLAFIPFAILLAACGMHLLLEWRHRAGRWIVAALLVASAAQFGAFLRDYWTGYRERSFFFYGGDMGGAVRRMLASTDDVRCVQFDKRVPILDYWLLYTRVKGLDEDAQRPIVIDADVADVTPPAGCRRAALLVHEQVSAANGIEARLIARGWRKEPIPEPGNRSHLTLFWFDAN